jgi:glycosyltransferase involved in cell wall biosynthesis
MASIMITKSPKLHIGLLFSNFHSGGIQRVMLNLASGLIKLGWSVDLLLVEAIGPLKEDIPAGCKLYDFQEKHVSRAMFKLVSYLLTDNPNVVLSSQTHINIVMIFARMLSKWKGRLIISEHIALDFAASNPHHWVDRFFPFLASIFYRQADKILLVSTDTARHFIDATHLPDNLIKVIYNPIVTENLLILSKYPNDHTWFTNQDFPVVLSAGRLTQQKDFDTLLRAFSLVMVKIPSVKLILLGEGEELTHLEQLSQKLGIQDSIEFIGFTNNPFSYMANSSVFVLSSRWEGFGNVLVEAMACGCPVISTDCPSGPSEILDRGKYGRLVPVGDPKALAEAIILELNYPHNKNQLVDRANQFSIDWILPQYVDLFTQELD